MPGIPGMEYAACPVCAPAAATGFSVDAFAVAAIPAIPAVVRVSEVNKSSPVSVLDLRGMETSCCVGGGA